MKEAGLRVSEGRGGARPEQAFLGETTPVYRFLWSLDSSPSTVAHLLCDLAQVTYPSPDIIG